MDLTPMAKDGRRLIECFYKSLRNIGLEYEAEAMEEYLMQLTNYHWQQGYKMAEDTIRHLHVTYEMCEEG